MNLAGSRIPHFSNSNGTIKFSVNKLIAEQVFIAVEALLKFLIELRQADVTRLSVLGNIFLAGSAEF